MRCSIADDVPGTGKPGLDADRTTGAAKPRAAIARCRPSGRAALPVIVAIAGASLVAGCSRLGPREAAAAPTATSAAPAPGYQRETIIREAEGLFGRGAEGLAAVVDRVFRDRGNPSAYIKGEEGGGAFGVGLRYGRGILYRSDGTSEDVFWRGPSVGIDVGGSAAKAFILVYDLNEPDALFTRFGGVEGSLFVVGGVGVNYNRSGETLLAPVRFGVGWRQGVSVGYLHLSRERSWVPF